VLAEPEAGIGETVVAGHDRAALARRDVLRRVEGEAGDLAPAPDGKTAIDGAEGVAGILEQEAIRAESRAQGVDRRDMPRIMDDDRAAGPVSEAAREILGIQHEGLRVDVDEDRTRAGEQHRIGRREERERGHEHLVPRPDAERLERDLQGRGPARDRDRPMRARRRPQPRLEGPDHRALGQASGSQHLRDGLAVLVPDLMLAIRDHEAWPSAARLPKRGTESCVRIGDESPAPSSRAAC